MSTHLTIKNGNRPNTKTPTHNTKRFAFSRWIVAGNMICFVLGNKGSAGVKNLSEKGSVKHTRIHQVRETLQIQNMYKPF